MARKNLFTPASGPPGSPAASGSGAAPGPAGATSLPPRSGVVNPLSLMRDDLQKIVREIDTDLIVSSAFSDRLFDTDPDMPALRDSIAAHGQMVPALIRPLPSDGGPRRFEIVYGRRRLAAARALGRPLRAVVQDLGNLEALHAMGIENNQRRNTSFIEKAFFARRLRTDSGLTLRQIAEILSVHESHASRMIGIADALGEDVVRQLGFCEGVGRRPWDEMARRFELLQRRDPDLTLPDMTDVPMDDRFAYLSAWLVAHLDADPAEPADPPPMDGEAILGDHAGDHGMDASPDAPASHDAVTGSTAAAAERGEPIQAKAANRTLKLRFGRQRKGSVHYSRSDRGIALRFLVSQDTDGFDRWFDRNAETVLEEIRSMWLAAQAAKPDEAGTTQDTKGGAMTPE